jgi:hypothetical protein
MYFLCIAVGSQERLWPDYLPDNTQHAELFFNVLPALPASILASLFK